MAEPTRISLCIPLYGGVSSEWVKHLLKLIFSIQSDPSLSLDIIYDDAQPVAKSRNNMLRVAAQKNPQPHFLLWLDSDNLLDFTGLKSLLEDNCDMVSALYFMRQPPHKPVIMKNVPGQEVKEWMEDFPKQTLFECDGVGMGCCLMKWHVAEKLLQQHEFPFDYVRIAGKDGKPTYLSEDIVFCGRARAVGFKIRVDSRVISGHMGGVVAGR